MILGFRVLYKVLQGCWKNVRIIFYITVTYALFMWSIPNNPFNCHMSKIPSLKDILDEQPKAGSFFFLDTSCDSYKRGKILINKRQACAVESVAKLHPNRSVYLLYGSSGLIEEEYTESDRLLKALLTYKNVHISHLNILKFLKGTPAEEFSSNAYLLRSDHARIHLNHLLRLVILWRFAGIYLDFDLIIKRPFDKLHEMFVTLESDARMRVSYDVLSFTRENYTRMIMSRALDTFQKEYNKDDPEFGVDLFNRLIRDLYYNEPSKLKNGVLYNDLRVYPQTLFHPVSEEEWEMLYKEAQLTKVRATAFTSVGVRFWNKKSHNIEIPLRADVYYLNLAFQCCPRVIGQCDDSF